MSKHSIMKELNSETLVLTADDLQEKYSCKNEKDKLLLTKVCMLFVAALIVGCSVMALNKLKIASIESGETISMISAPIAATAAKKDVISIPNGIVKANPFVPYRTLKGDAKDAQELINDVPKFDLISPPETVVENSEAAKIMDTVVSGILYDKFSPSAILNIDGNDYLVKKGDTINNYKVLAIAQNSVTVKLGNNTYTAGIGELLTEGSVNYNDVSNLSKKFGGEKR